MRHSATKNLYESTAAFGTGWIVRKKFSNTTKNRFFVVDAVPGILERDQSCAGVIPGQDPGFVSVPGEVPLALQDERRHRELLERAAEIDLPLAV